MSWSIDYSCITSDDRVEAVLEFVLGDDSRVQRQLRRAQWGRAVLSDSVGIIGPVQHLSDAVAGDHRFLIAEKNRRSNEFINRVRPNHYPLLLIGLFRLCLWKAKSMRSHD
jgi:hypothetical protein